LDFTSCNYNYSLYNHTTHKPETLSSWQNNLHFCLLGFMLNSGIWNSPYSLCVCISLRQSFANGVQNTLSNSSARHIHSNSLLKLCYHGYVSKSSIRTQSNSVFCVTMRMCLTKLHPVDAQVPAFKLHFTVCFIRVKVSQGHIHMQRKNWITGIPRLSRFSIYGSL
jgi:hypothetical protein